LALWHTGRLTDRQRDRETGNTETGKQEIQRYKLRQKETKKIHAEGERERQKTNKGSNRGNREAGSQGD
jgi:hypothetical protein